METDAKLLNKSSRNQQNGTTIISNEISYKLGALVEGLAANTDMVQKLVESIGKLELSHNSLSGKFETLENGLKKANEDLMSMSKTLANLGIDEDTKKDLQYLRLIRKGFDDRAPVLRAVKIMVVCAIVAVIGGFIWTSVQTQTKIEISKQVK